MEAITDRGCEVVVRRKVDAVAKAVAEAAAGDEFGRRERGGHALELLSLK